jgi:hypothetical protein
MYKLLIDISNLNDWRTPLFAKFVNSVGLEFGGHCNWDDVRTVLSRYHAILDDFKCNLLFETEEDMSFFVLTYS